MIYLIQNIKIISLISDGLLIKKNQKFIILKIYLSNLEKYLPKKVTYYGIIIIRITLFLVSDLC